VRNVRGNSGTRFGAATVRERSAALARLIPRRLEAALLLLIVPLIAASGCSSSPARTPPVEVFADMDHQPKYQPQAASAFFADGRASRPPVPGTVALGHLKEDDAFYRGVVGEHYVGENPLPLDMEALRRGQQRFNIYCSPCHDRAGTGRGIVAMKSAWLATDLTSEPVQEMADGELFSIITSGRRSMPGYRFQVRERDRWAVVGYVRALQRAALGAVEDVPPELRDGIRPPEPEVQMGLTAAPADPEAGEGEKPPSEAGEQTAESGDAAQGTSDDSSSK